MAVGLPSIRSDRLAAAAVPAEARDTLASNERRSRRRLRAERRRSRRIVSLHARPLPCACTDRVLFHKNDTISRR